MVTRQSQPESELNLGGADKCVDDGMRRTGLGRSSGMAANLHVLSLIENSLANRRQFLFYNALNRAVDSPILLDSHAQFVRAQFGGSNGDAGREGIGRIGGD
jgi:hypothetical protein